MFSHTSSGNYFGDNNNTGHTGSTRPIVPEHQQQQQYRNDHHHQSVTDSTAGVTQISGARPNQKRQPHGGAKSHKLLDEVSFQNLFVARLPRTLTSNDAFLQVFAHYHPVSATIMMNVETGQSKGFGFVTFDTEAEGQQASENLNNRKLRVEVEEEQESITTSSPSSTKKKNIVFFTPEIKPSTFNGHRIVVESPHVYIRNIPVALFFNDDDEEDQQQRNEEGSSSSCFVKLNRFFSRFGEVEHMELHGGRSSLFLDQQIGTADGSGSGVAPPVLVSFASKEQASAAISACHGKVVFPELSATALMAKYADMTTVKSINRHNRSSYHGSSEGSRRRNENHHHSPSDGAYPANTTTTTTTAGGVGLSTATFPFPTGPLPRGDPQQQYQAIVPVQKNYSDGSLPSPASASTGTSRAVMPHLQRRLSPPMTDFWTPLLSLPPHHLSASSSSSSYATASKRGGSSRRSSLAAAASTSYHSTSEPQQQLHRQNSSASATTSTLLYRNDPYNLSGYVMVTSSSSSSSSSSASSSFVLGQ